jgi:hypothetical protein
MEQRLQAMGEAIAKQDEAIGAISKEKKKREEENRQLTEVYYAHTANQIILNQHIADVAS